MNTNTKDIKDLQDRGIVDRVTIKSLYRKIIALEVKFDTMWDENRKVRHQFKVYVRWLMMWIVIDVIFSVIFIGMHF